MSSANSASLASILVWFATICDCCSCTCLASARTWSCSPLERGACAPMENSANGINKITSEMRFIGGIGSMKKQVVFRSPNFKGRNPASASIGSGARCDRQRLGSFQILNHRAQINRFGIKGLVLRDLGAVQNLKSVSLEHHFAAPAFECDDLSVNAFVAASVQVTQIRAHQRAGRGHFPRVRKQIDVKMRNATGRRRHYPPAIHERPANESARA